MRRPILLAAAAALVLAAGFAAAATLARGSSAKADRGGSLVALRKTALGTVLVDARGRTLYLFEADKGRTSVCYGKCAAFWPPLISKGAPRAGAGIHKALLGVTMRRNGAHQVTYAGHPLYFFVKDTRAGQTLGQNLDFFGGEWYVLGASGRKITKKPSTSAVTSGSTTTTPSTTTTTGGGGGYGGGGYGY